MSNSQSSRLGRDLKNDGSGSTLQDNQMRNKTGNKLAKRSSHLHAFETKKTIDLDRQSQEQDIDNLVKSLNSRSPIDKQTKQETPSEMKAKNRSASMANRQKHFYKPLVRRNKDKPEDEIEE